MNASGRFAGLCRMTSQLDDKANFNYWAADYTWRGVFSVEWIFIKDIQNKHLKDFVLSNNDGRPVTNSRDNQEIPRKEGESMIELFENFPIQTSILQHFEYFDKRQIMFEKLDEVQAIISSRK